MESSQELLISPHGRVDDEQGSNRWILKERSKGDSAQEHDWTAEDSADGKWSGPIIDSDLLRRLRESLERGIVVRFLPSSTGFRLHASPELLVEQYEGDLWKPRGDDKHLAREVGWEFQKSLAGPLDHSVGDVALLSHMRTALSKDIAVKILPSRRLFTGAERDIPIPPGGLRGLGNFEVGLYETFLGPRLQDSDDPYPRTSKAR